MDLAQIFSAISSLLAKRPDADQATRDRRHMGRHTIVNPTTGRRVYKTGRIGRAVQKGKKKKPKSNKPKSNKPKSNKPKPTKTSVKKYGAAGSTKRPSPVFKSTANGTARPSARAMYDAGIRGPVIYNSKYHVMAFRANGSPYYKAIATVGCK